MADYYKESGVDIEKGYESVQKIQKHISRTKRKEVLSDLGGFGGLFELDTKDYSEPVLVSGTDGVGTKILLAQETGRLDTIGIDCVAMCVNDVLAQGAEPLFFLDYLAVGKNDPAQIEQIVSGVAEGCVQSGSALIGGETAEMPDLYSEQEFDLAGFSVGVADKKKMFQADMVKNGDVLIGLPSSGIHSNGYSLVRKLFFKDHDWKYDDQLPDGTTLIDALLEPTKIYVKDAMPFVKKGMVHGISHITGGGFYENLPRMFNDNQQANIQLDAIESPVIFDVMQGLSGMETEEMYRVFNMGIGLVLAVDEKDAEYILQELPEAKIIGSVEEKIVEDAVVLNSHGVKE